MLEADVLADDDAEVLAELVAEVLADVVTVVVAVVTAHSRKSPAIYPSIPLFNKFVASSQPVLSVIM